MLTGLPEEPLLTLEPLPTLDKKSSSLLGLTDKEFADIHHGGMKELAQEQEEAL
jgi:hypothetical protein